MKKILLKGILIVSLTACSPIVTTHGFNSYNHLQSWVAKNTVLQDELQSRFGPASFVDTDNTITSYYYIQFTKERYAFFKPEISDRKILVISFDNNQYVGHNEYSLADGKDIKIVSQTTPTYGKELSVIQQLLSNVGKFNNMPGQGRGAVNGSVLGPIPGGI